MNGYVFGLNGERGGRKRGMTSRRREEEEDERRSV